MERKYNEQAAMFYAAYYDGGYKVLKFDASKARRIKFSLANRARGYGLKKNMEKRGLIKLH